MVQNDEMTNAIGTLATIVSERAELLRANACDPQTLIDSLGNLNYQLLACIDPDELEQQA